MPIYDEYIPAEVRYRLRPQDPPSICPAQIILGPGGTWKIELCDAPYDLHDQYNDEHNPEPLMLFLDYLTAAAMMLPRQTVATNGPVLWASLHCPALGIHSTIRVEED